LRISSASASSSEGPASPAIGSGPAPVRKATRFTISESACRISIAKPIGTRARAGQNGRPPAFGDTSCETRLVVKTGQDSHRIITAIGSRKSTVPRMSIQTWVRREKRP